jgi:DNA-binding NarL/FixJ family response regulator
MIHKEQLITLVSIVEDDPSIRQILTEWINHAEGFRCHSVQNSAESALAKLPEEKPLIVLMDINLPGQNGIECVRRLKPIMPDTQFVMLTAYEDTKHIFDALKAGASGYLLKRKPREELIAALNQVREGGSPMTSYIARKVVQSFHRVPAEESEHATLAPRELEVLELLARGHYYKEIADTLGIGVQTVGTYVRRIYNKLHVHSRGQAVSKYNRFRTSAADRPRRSD